MPRWERRAARMASRERQLKEWVASKVNQAWLGRASKVAWAATGPTGPCRRQLGSEGRTAEGRQLGGWRRRR